MTSIGRYLVVCGGNGFLGRGDTVSDVAGYENSGTQHSSPSESGDETNERRNFNFDSTNSATRQDIKAESTPVRRSSGSHSSFSSGAESSHVPDFLLGEHTIFDLHLFDTETLKWKQNWSKGVPGHWPSARNGFTFTRLGATKAVIFGGGVFPTSYYQDTYVLDFELPIKVCTQYLFFWLKP